MKIERSEAAEQRRTGLPKKQRGITIVEYAVAAALIVVAVLSGFGALGNQIGSVLNNIVTGIG